MLLDELSCNSSVENTISKQISRFGEDLPERFTERPKIKPYLRLYRAAFDELDTERSLPELQPIPWSSIMRYAEVYNFNDALRTDFLYVIRSMDTAFLQELHSRRRQ